MVRTLFDFDIISEFNQQFYEGCLQKTDLTGKELFIKKLKSPDGEDLYTENEPFFYVLSKNHERFLLKSKFVSKLPIKVKEGMKVGYRNDGYTLITRPARIRKRAQKMMSFRELVDNFADFEHTHPKDFTLFKIICFAAYMTRMNFRLSTLPAFGKDSVLKLMNDLFNNVAVIQKPTFAKLEMLSENYIVACNEFGNLAQADKGEISQYLLALGGFSNNYVKHSRASDNQNREEYDTSKTSLVILFNTIDCYPDSSCFFDNLFSEKSILQRFLPIRLEGKLTQNFEHIQNASEVAKENFKFFENLIRTVEYYSQNWFKELDDRHEVPDFGFEDRFARSFRAASHFIRLYSESDEEYKEFVTLLYQRHVDYNLMINPPRGTLNQDFVSPTTGKKSYNRGPNGEPIVEEEIK